ncbi:MAG: methyltransferase family protein [Candidatus Helarchaeota archaeon]
MPHDHSEINYGEFPNTHLYHLIGIVSFFSIWILDSFVFEVSTFLAEYIHWIIRVIIACSLAIIGFIMSGLAHNLKFDKKLPGVIDSGVYRISRHPMYLGYIIAYIGAIIGTMSLLSIAPLIFILITNELMVNYEENKMVETFGDKYIEYQNKVPKWLFI